MESIAWNNLLSMSSYGLIMPTVLVFFFTAGVTAAKGGTLTFMVGGKDEAYEKAAKILQHMGKNVIHTGATGTGQVIYNKGIDTVANQL